MEQSAISAAKTKKKKKKKKMRRRQKKATQPTNQTEPNIEQKTKFSFIHTKIKKEVIFSCCKTFKNTFAIRVCVCVSAAA